MTLLSCYHGVTACYRVLQTCYKGVTRAYRLDFCSNVLPLDPASEVLIGQEQLAQNLQAAPL